MDIFIFYYSLNCHKKKEYYHYLFCLCYLFTKEYFLVLVLFSFVFHYFKFKNTNSIYATIILLVLFTLHFNFASSGITNNEGKNSVEFLILSYVLDYPLYFNSILHSLIIERNIMLFFPFYSDFFQ